MPNDVRRPPGNYVQSGLQLTSVRSCWMKGDLVSGRIALRLAQPATVSWLLSPLLPMADQDDGKSVLRTAGLSASRLEAGRESWGQIGPPVVTQNQRKPGVVISTILMTGRIDRKNRWSGCEGRSDTFSLARLGPGQPSKGRPTSSAGCLPSDDLDNPLRFRTSTC